MPRRLSLDTIQTIVALSACGIVGLAILFSVMVYSFEVTNNGIFDNEELNKRILTNTLKNTLKNRENTQNIVDSLSQMNNKLDKLLNQTSVSK